MALATSFIAKEALVVREETCVACVETTAADTTQGSAKQLIARASCAKCVSASAALVEKACALYTLKCCPPRLFTCASTVSRRATPSVIKRSRGVFVFLMEEEQNYKASVHRLPDIKGWKDYAWYPWLASKSYFKRVTSVLGVRFLLFLGVSQMMLKGLAYSMSMSMLMPLFKSVFMLNASQLQIYTLIVVLSWSTKPILGLLSDLTLIGGYHKRYWLLLALVIGTLSASFSFLAYVNTSGMGVALCFMGIQLQIALFDLLSESTYSIIMRDKDYTGSDLVTLVQGYQHVGALVATTFVGLFADHQLFYPLFAMLLAVCVLPVGPVILGWLPEEKDPHGVPQGNQTRCGYFFQLVGREQIKRDKWMIALIAFTGIAAPITTTVIEAADPAMGLAMAIVITSLVLLGAYIVFPRIVFKIALLQVALNLSRPKLGSSLDFYYTADATCVPGGPHFSYFLYMTVAGVMGTFTSFFGVVIYQAFLSGLRYRPVLVITAILSGASGMSDLFIVTRANKHLGIPDALAFLGGESIIEPVLAMLNYIPVTTLLSKAVPYGLESSAFAFLAGLNNFAAMISELSGALIFDVAGIKTTVPCNFDALWWLVILCHVSLPIVGGVAASFLIPNKYQTESLLDQEATTTDTESEEEDDAAIGRLSMSNNHFALVESDVED